MAHLGVWEVLNSRVAVCCSARSGTVAWLSGVCVAAGDKCGIRIISNHLP